MARIHATISQEKKDLLSKKTRDDIMQKFMFKFKEEAIDLEFHKQYK